MSRPVTALATAPGASPRAVIRVSGDGAIALLGNVFAPVGGGALADRASGRWIEGRARWTPDGGPGGACPAGLILFRAPRSYTGEEAAELHLPGNGVVARGVLAAIMAAGAAPAGPGEFTRRAFENGKVSLEEAEAVLAVIDAERDEDHAAAARALLEGRRTGISALRESAAELLARLEGSLDFAGEGIDFFRDLPLAGRLRDLEARAARLAGSPDTGGVAVPVPRVMLVGKANAGKSTLFNALSGAGAGTRTIESDVAGTTRDLVAAEAEWKAGTDKIRLLLVDTPGRLPVAPSPLTGEGRDGGGTDADVAGQEILGEALARKPFVLLVLDGSRAWGPEDAAVEAATRACPRKTVMTKADLERRFNFPLPLGGEGRSEGPLLVSARTGAGIPELREMIAGWITESRSRDPLAGSLAARIALAVAADRLTAAHAEAERGGAPELVALSLREAVEAFSPLFGDYPSDDILDRVFGRFCIGK